MNLETNKKKVTLVFTTKKIVNLTNTFKDKNFENLYFKAMREKDIGSLSEIIYNFAEDAENGSKAFKSVDEVYDFVDEYMLENKKNYEEIFKEIAEAINQEGFFNRKMKAEEMKEKMSDPFSSMELGKVVEDSVTKAIAQTISIAAEQEMTKKKFLNSKV